MLNCSKTYIQQGRHRYALRAVDPAVTLAHPLLDRPSAVPASYSGNGNDSDSSLKDPKTKRCKSFKGCGVLSVEEGL